MPLLDTAHYVDSVGYTAVTAWAVATAKAAGDFVRATAPALESERIYICIVAGTTHATTQPTWVTSRGAKTTDNTVTWQECTGLSGINGDATNTPTWATLKAFTSTGVLGQLIRNNAASHYFIMSTAGTIGASEPSFSTTTGATTVDNGATWTCIGAVGSFTGNQAPHIRMRNATATNWAAAGNDIYIKSSHAETATSSVTLGGTGTLAAPQRWLCHNGGAYPPTAANLTTGATCTSSASSFVLNQIAYVEGLNFVTSAAAQNITFGSVSGVYQYYKNCTFTRGSTTGTIAIGQVTGNAAGGMFIFDNCTCSFANVNNIMGVVQGRVLWKNSTFFAGAAVPTNVFNQGGLVSYATVELNGVDLSAAGSGKTLFAAPNNLTGFFRLVNCKINASVTVAATPQYTGHRIELINCDSGAVNYRSEIYDYAGTMTTETTIVLTDGASDGTTPISWQIDTNANAKYASPFICFPISIWNDDTGSSKTLTIQGIWGGGAVPNNDEIWVEVEYLGSSASPVASYVSDGKATTLTAATAQDAGTGTWGGSTTKFALSVAFTPQMKGVVTARVYCAKLSSTFYVDPKITLT